MADDSKASDRDRGIVTKASSGIVGHGQGVSGTGAEPGGR
jgi:hypothetical protein